MADELRVHDTFREWCSYCRPVAAEPDLATARSRGAKPRDVAQANSRRRHAPVPIAGTADSAYKKWYAAVAGAIFAQAKAHAPVYLDMNDETLAQIGRAVGLDADTDAEAHLVEAVRDTLSMQPPAKKKDAFRWHLNRLANWKNGELGSASIDNPLQFSRSWLSSPARRSGWATTSRLTLRRTTPGSRSS